MHLTHICYLALLWQKKAVPTLCLSLCVLHLLTSHLNAHTHYLFFTSFKKLSMCSKQRGCLKNFYQRNKTSNRATHTSIDPECNLCKLYYWLNSTTPGQMIPTDSNTLPASIKCTRGKACWSQTQAPSLPRSKTEGINHYYRLLAIWLKRQKDNCISKGFWQVLCPANTFCVLPTQLHRLQPQKHVTALPTATKKRTCTKCNKLGYQNS